LLLCTEHHEIIDQNAATYTVERLVGIKQTHEEWVAQQLSNEDAGTEDRPLVTETLHSSLLRVDRIPEQIYCAATDMDEPAIRALLLQRPAEKEVLPFLVRASTLMTFTDLTQPDNPFVAAFRQGAIGTRVRASSWWDDRDKSNWYVTLLNRTLHKLTGRKGLRFDAAHKRYYFEPERDANGKAVEMEVKYDALARESSRKVVWQPRRRKTNEVRGHWVHLALSLRFLRVNPTDWILALRPEHRFTKDGFELMPFDTVGPRATRLKSHLYNRQLLAELQFWKEFLSGKEPRIILEFGGQTMVIEAQLMRAKVEWPGVPGDELSFENTAHEDDLFTISAYDDAMKVGHLDAELDRWEKSDFETLVDDGVPENEGHDAGDDE
jgi:hypothetical protein